MKKLLILILPMMLLVSCAGGEPESNTYELTYVDGTTEVVTVDGTIEFDGTHGCVKVVTCGCGGEETFKCGVRDFESHAAPISDTISDVAETLEMDTIINQEKKLN